MEGSLPGVLRHSWTEHAAAATIMILDPVYPQEALTCVSSSRM